MGPHTHSTVELVCYYAGAVLYGYMPAVSYGLGAAALFVISGIAFRSDKPSLVKYRWYLLLAAAEFCLLTLDESLFKGHQFNNLKMAISIPFLVLLVVSAVRLAWMERTASKPAKKQHG